MKLKNLTLCAEWIDNMDTYRLFWTSSPNATITFESDIVVIRELAAIIGVDLIPIK